MNIRIKIKSIIKDFKYNLNLKRFEFLRIYFSPFKSPEMKFYFGPISVGTPYFLPRRLIKISRDAKYTSKAFKSVKWFQIKFVGLGYKTKWSSTDYRHEWDPILSIVFCKRQFVIRWEESHYSTWELWLYYENATNKLRSKEYRVRYCVLHNPCVWTEYTQDNESGTTRNYYEFALKKKYLHLM